MQRIILKSKIHRATITDANLNYEGSLGIDDDLLKAADIFPGEQVHVLNLNSGSRVVTYAIRAPAGSGAIVLNGAAARLGAAGDPVIILTYAHASSAEAASWKPQVIYVDSRNKIIQK
ncbi:MAG: aspartate 1-decarboxylase [Kiritimatiellae bacterium]|nr:aspartate 1-decarboxylase [Kiritimatiellia bacterium]